MHVDSRIPGDQAARALLTLPQAATALSIGLRSLKALVSTGQLPVIRVTRRRVAVDPRDLDAFIASRRR